MIKQIRIITNTTLSKLKIPNKKNIYSFLTQKEQLFIWDDISSIPQMQIRHKTLKHANIQNTPSKIFKEKPSK